MSSLNLISQSQDEWLKKGGSTAALEFIGNVVSELNQKAMDEGIVHKEADTKVEDIKEDVKAKDVKADVTADATATDVTQKGDAVDTSEKGSGEGSEAEESNGTTAEVDAEKETGGENADESSEKSTGEGDEPNLLVELLFAAQKQYHESVVVPLLKQVKDLTEEVAKTKKSTSTFGNVFAASDMLPPAAIAERVKSEFATEKASEVDEIVGKEAKDDDNVVEATVVTDVNDANLFAQF